MVDAPEQRADLKRTPETQVIQRCQREDAEKVVMLKPRPCRLQTVQTVQSVQTVQTEC